MTYEILSRREIPLTETVRGLITGKTITYPLGNGGKKCVAVRLSNGFMAVGFGVTYEQAEMNAVSQATELAAAEYAENRQAAEYAENRHWADSAAERNFGA